MLGWALNEEQNVESYLLRAEAFLRTLTDDFEVIVIDDGSNDRTLAVLEELGRARPWLRLYRNERVRGSGYNAKRAISLARKDYLFWQTVDWAYDLACLPEALPFLGRHDILQGVRFDTVSVAGLFGRRSDNAYKGLVSITNYLLVRALFRLPLHDYQNVTIYPRPLIQSVTLESESAFTNPECLLKVWWKGASIQEFPVPFLKRQRGTAKGTRPGVIVRSVADIVRWWTRWILLGRRPDRGRGTVSYWKV
jgi:glycosyltransferase involved in cell wall biosynthesis